MNIAGLFGKKKKEDPKSKQSKAIQSIGELDKGIQDLEAQIDFNEKRANAIQEEAKAKLKAGDKNGAKKLLVKRKRHLGRRNFHHPSHISLLRFLHQLMPFIFPLYSWHTRV